jgi:hypothetical protein
MNMTTKDVLDTLNTLIAAVFLVNLLYIEKKWTVSYLRRAFFCLIGAVVNLLAIFMAGGNAGYWVGFGAWIGLFGINIYFYFTYLNNKRLERR